MSTVNVVQYNVLHLNAANRELYPYNEHALDLDNVVRLRSLIGRLREQMDKQNSVICLQELSKTWAEYFIAWFSNFEYTLVYRLYDNGGEMGIAIAFPAQEFYVNNCFFKKPADVLRQFRMVLEAMI